MILDTTTKSLEIDLDEAHTTNAMPITVDYVDLTASATTGGSSDTQSNGTTVVTILAAPAASTQRKVNFASVYNADTVTHNVTIQLNNNATLRTITKATISSGETLQYTDTIGWELVTSTGVYLPLANLGTGVETALAVNVGSNGSFAKHEAVSLYPTVASATTVDIFGAAGATVSLDNSTPVTTTGFTACTAAQVGSVKRIIPAQAWSITASASMTIDGLTAGTFSVAADCQLEVVATTTTTFVVTTKDTGAPGLRGTSITIGFTRDNTAASGVINYTGFIGKPKHYSINARESGLGASCWGQGNLTSRVAQYWVGAFASSALSNSFSISITPSGAGSQSGVVTAFSQDTVEITWTKNSSPAAGTTTGFITAYF